MSKLQFTLGDYLNAINNLSISVLVIKTKLIAINCLHTSEKDTSENDKLIAISKWSINYQV